MAHFKIGIHINKMMSILLCLYWLGIYRPVRTMDIQRRLSTTRVYCSSCDDKGQDCNANTSKCKFVRPINQIELQGPAKLIGQTRQIGSSCKPGTTGCEILESQRPVSLIGPLGQDGTFGRKWKPDSFESNILGPQGPIEPARPVGLTSKPGTSGYNNLGPQGPVGPTRPLGPTFKSGLTEYNNLEQGSIKPEGSFGSMYVGPKKPVNPAIPIRPSFKSHSSKSKLLKYKGPFGLKEPVSSKYPTEPSFNPHYPRALLRTHRKPLKTSRPFETDKRFANANTDGINVPKSTESRKPLKKYKWYNLPRF